MKRVKPYKLIKNVLNQGLRIIYKNLYIIIYYLFFYNLHTETRKIS